MASSKGNAAQWPDAILSSDFWYAYLHNEVKTGFEMNNSVGLSKKFF